MKRLCVLLVVAVSLPSVAADWPQFLGPRRNGTTTEKGLLKEWPDGGPREVWRVECRGGLSGIAVAGRRALTMTQSDGDQAVVAYDVQDGTRLWRTPVTRSYRNQQGNGPRATPAVHGDRVFAFSGDGVLAALELETGALAWKTDLLEELGGKPADYGLASSPLVVGDLVIVTAGAERGCVVACDVRNGRIRWHGGSGPAGYSSPVLAQISGASLVLAFTGTGLSAFEPVTGNRVWTYDFKTDYECNTASPVITGNQILISAGENHGSVMLEASASGVREVWQSLGPRSTLRAEWQTPIRVGAHIFGLDNVGSAGTVTHLTCVDAETGKTVWREPRFGKGNLTLADGKLWISTMKGELVLVTATPDGFKELGRKRYLGMTRQAPVIADGRLFFRDEKEIVCLKVR